MYKDQNFIGKSFSITITIPSGVKVIDIYASADSKLTSEISHPEVAIIIKNNDTQWLNASSEYVVSGQRYIGVTPSKQYTLSCVFTSARGLTLDCSLIISYSSTINSQTPDVTDY